MKLKKEDIVFNYGKPRPINNSPATIQCFNCKKFLEVVDLPHYLVGEFEKEKKRYFKRLIIPHIECCNCEVTIAFNKKWISNLLIDGIELHKRFMEAESIRDKSGFKLMLSIGHMDI